MRSPSRVLALALSVVVVSIAGQAQGQRRLNPMIALHEKQLPVFGLTHPAIVAGGGRGRGAAPDAPGDNIAPAAPVPPPSLMEAARQTMAYRFSDFDCNSYSTANAS